MKWLAFWCGWCTCCALWCLDYALDGRTLWGSTNGPVIAGILNALCAAVSAYRMGEKYDS